MSRPTPRSHVPAADDDPALDAFLAERDSRLDRWRDRRTYLGVAGGIFVSLGLLVLAVVAYQLWGTDIQEARAQRDLRHRFDEMLSGTVPPASIAPDSIARLRSRRSRQRRQSCTLRPAQCCGLCCRRRSHHRRYPPPTSRRHIQRSKTATRWLACRSRQSNSTRSSYRASSPTISSADRVTTPPRRYPAKSATPASPVTAPRTVHRSAISTSCNPTTRSSSRRPPVDSGTSSLTPRSCSLLTPRCWHRPPMSASP